MITVYTIGYGGRSFEKFLFLLRERGITILVDVRRFPKSKDQSYNREKLEEALATYGIKYVFLGETLGRFRRGYEKHVETEAYREGIKRLLSLVEQGEVALMCVERSPRACHRRYISKTLEDSGIQVEHMK